MPRTLSTRGRSGMHMEQQEDREEWRGGADYSVYKPIDRAKASADTGPTGVSTSPLLAEAQAQITFCQTSSKFESAFPQWRRTGYPFRGERSPFRLESRGGVPSSRRPGSHPGTREARRSFAVANLAHLCHPAADGFPCGKSGHANRSFQSHTTQSIGVATKWHRAIRSLQTSMGKARPVLRRTVQHKVRPACLSFAHLSIAGGLHNAVAAAVELQCETVQLFTKNASQWNAKPLTASEIEAFRSALASSGLRFATATTPISSTSPRLMMCFITSRLPPSWTNCVAQKHLG